MVFVYLVAFFIVTICPDIFYKGSRGDLEAIQMCIIGRMQVYQREMSMDWGGEAYTAGGEYPHMHAKGTAQMLPSPPASKW